MPTMVAGQPVANFSATPTTGCAPLVVQFSDNSSGNPATWAWDFGNGITSSLKNPVTTYLGAGIYSVKLTVTNTGSTNTITKTQYITVYDIPAVKFSVTDSADCVPFATSFTDQSNTSVGSINAWEWDFDDGTASTLQHPQHLYTQPGNYNITLKVANSGGCFSSLSKLAYIKAADSIRTLFSFSAPTKCKPPETIRFTNSTLGPGSMTYLWNFGDGGTSTQTSTSHTYANSGLYTVTLVVTNNLGCKDTLVYKDTVAIKNIRAVISSMDSVCLNNTVPFTNATVPAPLTSKWSFGDGTSSFGATTAKTWTAPGIYRVKLVSNFINCSDSVIKNITVLTAPTVNFAASPDAACKPPLDVNFIDLSGPASSWNWDFGDGFTSTLQNPPHVFTTEDTFKIKLTVANSAGCSNSITKHRFIKVARPLVDFLNAEEGGCIPYTFKPTPITNSVDGVATYWWDFGNGDTSSAMLPTEIYTDSGSYIVKLYVTSNGGCSDSAVMQDAVKTGRPPIVNFGVGATTVCPGTEIQFSDSSAPADKWQWSFNDGKGSILKDPTHRFSDTGKYSVKLVAWNNGCSDSLSKSRIITILPGLARFRPVYNCSNKKEVYFKDSSILPQNWFWDFGDGYTSTEQNPTHQFAGFQTYNVSLTTSNDSCSNTRTVPVDLYNEVPDFKASRNSLCKNDSAFFQFQNFNKNNILKYNWDFGDGSIDSSSTDNVWHSYNVAGLYNVSVSIKDKHGCIETTTKQGFVHVYSPNAGFSINAAGGCQNKAVNFTDTSNVETGDHNIALWYWDFGDGAFQTYTPPLPNLVTHIYNNTGAYYPSLKIVDSAGCADSVSNAAPIGIYQPIANFSSPNFNTCVNDTISLRNLSSGQRLKYLWSFGDGSFSADSLPIKQYAANGLYTMKLLVTDTFGCKDSLRKINYINVKTVSAAFSVSDSVGLCIPFKVNFTNRSANSLSQVWDFGDGGFSTTANPVYYYSAPGTYFAKLKAIRSPGCYNTDSVKITVTAPTATLSYVPLSGCAPLDVSFEVSTADIVSFIWDFNDGTSFGSFDSSVVHTFLLPGNFVPSVILKDSMGCIIPVVGKDSIKLFSSRVNFRAADTIFCNDGSVNFFDSTVSGGTINSFYWDFGDGNFSNQKNPVHYYSGPGQYTVKLAVSTTNGCQDSLIKTNFIRIFTRQQISIDGIAPGYCGPSQLSMQGNWQNPDSTALSWSWQFGNGNGSLLQNPAPQQYNNTGSYTVLLVTNNAGGCVDTAAYTVFIHPIPNTFAGFDTVICNGNTANLSATGADSYTWAPANFLSCTNCSNPNTSAAYNISYYVKGTSVFGCEKTDTISVLVKQPFNISGLKSIDSICEGNSIQLTVTGAENYLWSPAGGLNSNLINDPVASPVASTTYKVVGYDSNNCFKDSAVIFIKVNANPIVNAGTDLVINAGRIVTLTPRYSPDVNTWLWEPPAALSCTTCPNPGASPGNNTNYKVTVTNSNGCVASDELLIKVVCDNSSIYLPTAFSPGNSQANQVFFPLNTPGAGAIKIVSLVIYNRYGQVVFENGNFYSNDRSAGWDGKYNGLECAVGAYLYSISFVCNNKQQVSFSGNFLLIR